jgi:hypothetical protein
MRAQRADDFRVPDVDVGVVISGFRGLRYRRHELDSGKEASELKSLRDHLASPAPARKVSELALNRNV